MYYLSPISADQVTPGIESLFDPSKPTMPRAFSVLEGINRGQILVDDPLYPTVAIVHEVIYGTLYIGGAMNAALLDSLIKHFCDRGEIGIGCWLDDPLNEMISSKPDYDGRTLYFTDRSHAADRQTSLPEGYHLALRDEKLLKQSFDYESTLASFFTEENIMKHTLGVDILFEDQVVCEAATGAPTHGWIEVGVMTDASHRQRGLASIACAHLIGMCEAKGLKTWWDCARQNIPSVKLAHKLGYQNEREYRYVWWSGK